MIEELYVGQILWWVNNEKGKNGTVTVTEVKDEGFVIDYEGNQRYLSYDLIGNKLFFEPQKENLKSMGTTQKQNTNIDVINRENNEANLNRNIVNRRKAICRCGTMLDSIVNDVCPMCGWMICKSCGICSPGCTRPINTQFEINEFIKRDIEKRECSKIDNYVVFYEHEFCFVACGADAEIIYHICKFGFENADSVDNSRRSNYVKILKSNQRLCEKLLDEAHVNWCINYIGNGKTYKDNRYGYFKDRIYSNDIRIKVDSVVTYRFLDDGTEFTSKIIMQPEEDYWGHSANTTEEVPSTYDKKSTDSPFGRAILDRFVGERFCYSTPTGEENEVEVINIDNRA